MTATGPLALRSRSRGAVVLLDDDQTLVRVLSKLLRSRLHLTVEGFTNGAAAMNWISRHPASLLITDEKMPGPSGLEVVRWLRMQPGHGSTPVLMLTGMDGPDLSAAAAVAGVSRLISKPVPADHFLDAVELLLQPSSTTTAIPPE